MGRIWTLLELDMQREGRNVSELDKNESGELWRSFTLWFLSYGYILQSLRQFLRNITA